MEHLSPTHVIRAGTALCSLAVDFRVGEAVNNVQMVYGVIPKRLFRRALPYWAAEARPRRIWVTINGDEIRVT